MKRFIIIFILLVSSVMLKAQSPYLNLNEKEVKDKFKEEEIAKDWWDTLSVEDFDTVNCCI